MVAKASVLWVRFGSASVSDGGPYDAVQASEYGLGSPEAPESKDRAFQGLAVWWVPRRFRSPIRDSDALRYIGQGGSEENQG